MKKLIIFIVTIMAIILIGCGGSDTSNFLPDKCTLDSGFQCSDFSATSTEVSLKIRNMAGYNANDVSIKVANVVCTGDSTINNGNQGSYKCSGNFKGQINDKITINYKNSATNLDMTKEGDLIVRIN